MREKPLLYSFLIDRTSIKLFTTKIIELLFPSPWPCSYSFLRSAWLVSVCNACTVVQDLSVAMPYGVPLSYSNPIFWLSEWVNTIKSLVKWHSSSFQWHFQLNWTYADNRHFSTFPYYSYNVFLLYLVHVLVCGGSSLKCFSFDFHTNVLQ